MEERKQPAHVTAKEKKLKIALSCTALLLVAVMAWLLILKNSGAWLVDQGEWSNGVYTVGRIDYTYEINGSLIDLEKLPDQLNLAGTVPLIGGVKLNDQQTDTAAPHYEAHADANFNEGVTLAHITIVNKSDFPVKFRYTLSFQRMADDTPNPQNLFYLVLPKGSAVDSDKKTIALPEAAPVTYKTYIKDSLNNPTGYERMLSEFAAYHATEQAKAMKDQTVLLKRGEALSLDILFWSEYNSTLPFVTNAGGKDDVLMDAADPISKLDGQFTMTINIAQTDSTTGQAKS